MASTDSCLPKRGIAGEITAAEVARALDPAKAEEVIRVGPWSVRRLGELGLIYVHTEEGRVQVKPPQEVLSALHLEASGEDSPGGGSPRGEVDDAAGGSPRSEIDDAAGDGEDVDADEVPAAAWPPAEAVDDADADASAVAASGADSGDDSGGGGEAEEGTTTEEPSRSSSASGSRFRRIVIGARCEVPLKMARDILEALREDSSIFSEVQRRFSDSPEESILGLASLGEDLEVVASGLEVGEVSDVVGTEAGVMHILMRVS